MIRFIFVSTVVTIIILTGINASETQNPSGYDIVLWGAVSVITTLLYGFIIND